ncbi:hypothetical protein B0T18DRAFT_409349 [Schizothecium vesticola]|uniref:Secreted protein n=1 Tax=Schizothecium vesticola TaxID=314040 RepID=A0AA40K9R0_9PEZI|nr:hypothetical protein B0T18DRAFT_409349 [Schizothecium vesticola]
MAGWILGLYTRSGLSFFFSVGSGVIVLSCDHDLDNPALPQNKYLCHQRYHTSSIINHTAKNGANAMKKNGK